MSYGVGPNLAGGLLMGPGVGWNNSLTIGDPLAPGDPCTNPGNPGGSGGPSGPGTPGGTDGPGGPNGPGDPGGSCTADGSGSGGDNAPGSGGGSGDMPDNFGGSWGQNGGWGGNVIPLTWGSFGLPIVPLSACAPPTGPVGPLPGPGGPPSGVAPPPIPTTGLTVSFLLAVGSFSTTLDGLLVTCLETGETQPTTCSGQPSYALGRDSVPDGPCATLSTPGGAAEECLGPVVHTYSSGSATVMASGGAILTPLLTVTQLS